MKPDYVEVADLELPCRVGITDEERAFPQVLTVTFRVEFPTKKAGTSDRLEDAIDYAVSVQKVKEITIRGPYNLVEKVAEDIATLLLEHPLANAAEVRVQKKVFAGIRSVGVLIRREKASNE